jgi:hypothetical protein
MRKNYNTCLYNWTFLNLPSIELHWTWLLNQLFLKVLSCLSWLLLKCSKLTSWTLLHTYSHNFLCHYEELEAFESFGLALNFCSYIPTLSTYTQKFNTTLSSLEFQQNSKTKTLDEVWKCINSNTFPSFIQFFFFFIMLALTFKLCIVFYFLPKHGVPNLSFQYFMDIFNGFCHFPTNLDLTTKLEILKCETIKHL